MVRAKGKAHRTGTNQHLTNKTNATLKSSAKKWLRPSNRDEEKFKHLGVLLTLDKFKELRLAIET